MKDFEPLNRLDSLSSAREILDSICNKVSERLILTGLKGSSSAFLVSYLSKKIKQDIVLIAPDAEEAMYFLSDLDAFIPEKNKFYLPSSFKNDDLNIAYNPQKHERINTLNIFRNPSEKGRIMVTYPLAFIEKVASKQVFEKKSIQLQAGQETSMDFLIQYLAEMGFEATEFVTEAGYFSVRGFILDIYSYANEWPYRIEFNGDVIESIREFDPETQLSRRKLKKLTILSRPEDMEEALIDLFDFLPQNTLYIIVNPAYVRESVEKFCQLIKEKEIPTFIDLESWDKKQKEKIHLVIGADSSGGREIAFNTSPQAQFNKNFDLLIKHLQENEKQGIENYIFSQSTKQIERIYQIFEDKQVDVSFFPVYKNLKSGFIFHDLDIALFAEHEIFQRYLRPRSKQYTKDKALSLKDLYELKPGDYVTHINYGVGRFRGLEKIENNGKIQEALRIEYKDGDLLYVSIHSLHKISRYVGKEGSVPKIHRLGSKSWENLKNRTKSRVKDIARDLIKLYAKRLATKGFSYSPDSYLQNELEASFIYEDTPDQTRCTEDVKKDMEKPYPMDRLICGDVGYGKTEIAIRAAVKAAADSKQTAMLVPTTILAFQHYKTFTDRLKDFPVRVDYLSRFRSSKETKRIKKELLEGKIDIIIGTHKLLSSDIQFKDLGLLIIDEEQKFGVAAKEKLRSMRVNVDTLSLTATPIPRTLQFSLMGVRDLSILNTPPPNRQPIETYLHTFDRNIIREAIEKELERNGQVFFVHNRIHDLEKIGNIVKEEVPFAKIAVAHGRMKAQELEEIMINFIEGYYDVLVSTNIIESGLDIPNANTIIINEAHHFGLSDLYQMRGRVGRSNIKAYCYLLVPSFTSLTEEARKRLSTIEEYTDLGSGFYIAMRDLDIRGAGNLLGAEQSGFINEIGLDMYKKILDEAMEELREEEFPELFKDQPSRARIFTECQIETDLELHIPDTYISNMEERLLVYSRLNAISDEKSLQKFAEELEDRFGKRPYQINDLMDLIRIKWIGQDLGVQKVVLKNKKLKLFFPVTFARDEDFQKKVFERVLRFVKNSGKKCQFSEKSKGLEMTVHPVEFVDEALEIFKEIKRS